MQENSLPPQNSNPLPNSTDKKAVKGFTLLKMGILEIAFVGVTILLFFGVLNYFNILSVSRAFPEQLGWLPRQKTQTNLQTNSALQNPTPIIIPIPEYAKTDTKSLISDILVSSLIPNNLAIEKQNVENPYNFKFYGTGWNNENGENFDAIVEYDQTDTIIDRQITIYVDKLPSVLTTLSSTEIIKKYFTFTPDVPFNCIDLPTQIPSKFCEAFWSDSNNVKRGIDITSPVYGLNKMQIFYCEHHKGTPAYDWKSCNINYKETGIK